MKKYILSQKRLLGLVVLINIIVAGMSVYIAIILRDALDVALNMDMAGFRGVIIISAIFFPVFTIFYYLSQTVNIKLVGRIAINIREDVFNGIMRKSMTQFNSINSADYISALTNDIDLLIENYFVPLLSIMYVIVQGLFALTLMFLLSPIVGGVLVLTLILLIIIPALFGKNVQKKQDAVSKKASLFTVKMKEIFSGFEVIKSYQMDKHAKKTFKEQNKDSVNSELSLGYLSSLIDSISTLLGILSQVVVIFVSAFLIIQGNITGGTLLAFVQISGQITSPFQVIGACLPMIAGSKPVIERIEKLANQEIKRSGTKLAEFKTDITLKNLTFKYLDQEESALENINFTFKKNNKYLIAGKSGCGKTTLTKALIGYLDDYEGEILYDNVELKELSAESLEKLAVMIHQNVFMFDESIEQNILLHEDFENEVIDLAIKNSGVDLFLNSEKNLKTEVGENGSNLSGGQRQRIAVARALIQNKPLMIVDEGTSAIDKQTAKDIEHRLLERNELTLITITHSLDQDLLSQYDEILYMEGGQIVEHGPLEELLKQKGKFFNNLDHRKDF